MNMKTKTGRGATVKAAAVRPAAGKQETASTVEMPVVEHGGRGLVVSAKAVHAGLEVGRDFSTWLRSRISRYGFEEGIDFWEVGQDGELDSPERGKTSGGAEEFSPIRGKTSLSENDTDRAAGRNLGGRPEQDYWLSLDMAKELAMLERTPAGRRARKYFLECERRLKDAQQKLIAMGQAAQESGKAGGQPAKEYSLSEGDRQVFQNYLAMYDKHNKVVLAMDHDLDVMILPALLREALEDAGLDSEAIGRMELRGYGISFVAAKIAGRGNLRESDVAHRLASGEMSPRLVGAFTNQLEGMMLGRKAGRMEGQVARKLGSFGID